MQPTKASTVEQRPAPEPRLTDQLKKFAAREASQPPAPVVIDLGPSRKMTEPVTAEEYDFYLAHPKSGDLYPTAEIAQAAEHEYDRIRGKIFANEYQFKRIDGQNPRITEEEFLTLAEMFGKYGAANNGLRPAKPGESFEAYTESLDPKPAPTPTMPMFASNYDYRTQPLHWATDYRVYLDHQIAYLETELDRFMELTGRTVEQRRRFFGLNAAAALQMRDLGHPGSSGMAEFYPDLAADVMPLLDAASDILLTPVHRKFKLAPEQELDMMAHYAAWRHADIAAEHQRDFVNLFTTLDAFHEVAKESSSSSSSSKSRPDQMPTGPRKDTSPVRGGQKRDRSPTHDSELSAEADRRRRDFETRPQASTIASPFANAYRLRLDDQTYRYSLAQVEDMKRATESWCVASPAARLVIGATVVPFYPSQLRINAELDRIRALAPMKDDGTRDFGEPLNRSASTKATKRLIEVLDEESSKRSMTKTMTEAMFNVAWDVFMTGLAGAAVSKLKNATSGMFDKNLRNAEQAFIASRKSLEEAARSGARGIYNTIQWSTDGLVEAARSTAIMEKLAEQLGAANVNAFMGNLVSIENEAKSFFSGNATAVAQYMTANKMAMLNDLREQLGKNGNIPAQFKNAIGTQYDARNIRATEESSAVALAREMARSILSTGSPNNQFVAGELEKLVGKKEASETLGNLDDLLASIRSIEASSEQSGSKIGVIRDMAERAIQKAHGVALRPSFKSLTRKCDEVSCSVSNSYTGEVMVDRNAARAVTEINVALQYLITRARELHDRTLETRPPIDTARVVDNIRDYFRIRKWDIRSESGNFSEVTNYVVESCLATRLQLDMAFERNSVVRMKNVFVALDAAMKDRSRSYSESVVLPGKNDAAVVVTRDMADAVNAGSITTNPEFEWKEIDTPEDLVNRAHLLREIRVGGVPLPGIDGAKPEEALDIFTGLLRMRGMWTREKVTDLVYERKSAEGIEKLQKDARDASDTLEALVKTMFDATKSTRQELEDNLVSNGRRLVTLVRETRTSLLEVFKKIQDGSQMMKKSFNDLTEAMIAVSNGRRHHMSLADAVVDQLTDAAVALNTRGMNPDDAATYSASFRVYADRLIRVHFGDVLSNSEHTLDELMNVFNSGTTEDRFLLQKAHEKIIRESFQSTAAFTEAKAAEFLAADIAEADAADQRCPAWMKSTPSNIDFRQLTTQQKDEYIRWLNEVQIPAAIKLRESKGMRAIKDFVADDATNANRKSEIYKSVFGEPEATPATGLRGILGSVAASAFGYFQSAVYAQRLMNHMCAVNQSRQMVTAAGNKLISQGVRVLLAGGAIPVLLMRWLRLLILKMGHDGFWGTFAWVVPAPDNSVFFDRIEIEASTKVTPAFDSSSTGSHYVMYLLTALVAISARSGFDLFAHQILPDYVVRKITARTDEVLNNIVASRVGVEKAKQEVATHLEQRFAAMQKSGAQVDRNIGDQLAWMRRNDDEGLQLRTKASGFGWDWFTRNLFTNTYVSLGVALATTAVNYTFFSLLVASDRLGLVTTIAAAAIGHALPLSVSLVRNYVTARNDPPGTINAVNGGIGERWLLLKLIGRADVAQKLFEATFETVTYTTDDNGPRQMTRLKYNVGDSPLVMMRSIGPNANPPRWEDLSGNEREAFANNSLTEKDWTNETERQTKAKCLYWYLATEMRTRDMFHGFMLAYNRSGDAWARSGLAIVPQLMAYIANACRKDWNGKPGANRDALTFASALPTQAGAAIASLTLALSTAYGPAKSFSRSLLVSIFGMISTMWVATFAEAMPESIRSVFWFTMATMQGINAASSVVDLAVKFFAKDRAGRESVRQFVDELYAVGGLPNLKEREGRVGYVRVATSLARERLESHLLEMTVVGTKTSFDSYMQAGVFMWEFLFQNTLVQYAMEKFS